MSKPRQTAVHQIEGTRLMQSQHLTADPRPYRLIGPIPFNAKSLANHARFAKDPREPRNMTSWCAVGLNLEATSYTL